jgi:hypothetical protein
MLIICVKVQLQSQLATAITTCDQKHKSATTVTHLRLQTHLCDQRRIIATTVTHSRLQSHICVYSHTFGLQSPVLVHAIPQIVHIYRSPQKEEWVIPFLFHEDSDRLSLNSFPLPLPFTSTLSPFPFPPSSLQHQQGLATLVA